MRLSRDNRGRSSLSSTPPSSKAASSPRRRPTTTNPSSTSSSSARFMSYHAVRQQQDSKMGSSQSVDRQDSTGSRRPARLTFSLRLAAAVLLVLIAGYNLTLTSQPRLTITNASGVVSLRSKAAYQQLIAAQLSDSILNRTKLTLDTQALSTQILATYPELQSAQVLLPFMGRRPVVEVTSRRPAVILQTDDQKYVLDDTGRAIMALNDVPSDKRTSLASPLVVDKTSAPQKVGKQSLSASDVKFITNLIAQLEQKGVTVVSAELPPLASELHIRVEGAKYYIKCNMLTDPRIAAGQYLALRSQLMQQGEQPADYVDVRVEGKVFLK